MLKIGRYPLIKIVIYLLFWADIFFWGWSWFCDGWPRMVCGIANAIFLICLSSSFILSVFSEKSVCQRFAEARGLILSSKAGEHARKASVIWGGGLLVAGIVCAAKVLKGIWVPEENLMVLSSVMSIAAFMDMVSATISLGFKESSAILLELMTGKRKDLP